MQLGSCSTRSRCNLPFVITFRGADAGRRRISSAYCADDRYSFLQDRPEFAVKGPAYPNSPGYTATIPNIVDFDEYCRPVASIEYDRRRFRCASTEKTDERSPPARSPIEAGVLWTNWVIEFVIAACLLSIRFGSLRMVFEDPFDQVGCSGISLTGVSQALDHLSTS